MTTPAEIVGVAPGVVTGEIAGRQVVLGYGDAAREYESLRSGAMLVDRGERLRMGFSGESAAETLAGLVTNDVVSLSPGEGQFAAALTAKGKVVADLRIFREADRLLVDTSARAAEGWAGVVRKYVNPRLARYTDLSAQLRTVGLYGVESRRIVSEVTGVTAASLQVLPLHSHVRAQLPAGAVMIARVPDLGLEGYDLFGPAEALRELWERAEGAGATPAGLEAWEIARIEAGRPEWGVDMDENTLAHEANLEDLHAISYTKGCYTGQETVARVHFRGRVNRHLRGLRTTASDQLPAGGQLVDETGRPVGDVRSATLSPRLGNIALAMVRREVEPGSTVECRWAGGDAEVTVWPLPFPL